MPEDQEPKKTYDELMSPEALAESLGTPGVSRQETWQQHQNLTPAMATLEAPTNAAAWRSARRQGFNCKLPSGMVARIRRTLDLYERLREGTIPNPLSSIVMEMIQGKRASLEMQDLDETTLAQMLALIDETMAKMFIEPKVVMPPEDAPLSWLPEDDAICPADIDLQDKIFLFNVAQGGVADLATFRRQAEAFMGPVSDGGEVLGAPQPPSRS